MLTSGDVFAAAQGVRCFLDQDFLFPCWLPPHFSHCQVELLSEVVSRLISWALEEPSCKNGVSFPLLFSSPFSPCFFDLWFCPLLQPRCSRSGKLIVLEVVPVSGNDCPCDISRHASFRFFVAGPLGRPLLLPRHLVFFGFACFHINCLFFTPGFEWLPASQLAKLMFPSWGCSDDFPSPRLCRLRTFFPQVVSPPAGINFVDASL